MSFWDLWHAHPIGVPVVVIVVAFFVAISVETAFVSMSRRSK